MPEQTSDLRVPGDGERWRCAGCGNLTRFDVTRTRRTTEYWHFDLAGEHQVEEETVRSEAVEYEGSAAPLREVWVAVRASLRSVLEAVTLADVARGELPPAVAALAADRDAWLPH